MKRLPNIVLAVIFAFGLITAPISVQTVSASPGEIYVSVSGSDTSGDGSPENPYRTITKGINVSSADDTVLVHAGTYEENIVLPKQKVITIKSAEGAHNTIIDGKGSGHVIKAEGIAQITIDGFTIRNGSTSFIPDLGAGIFINACSPTITNCIITNNTATYGGGIYITAKASQPVISNCWIKDNTATKNPLDMGGWGGGIMVAGSASPDIINCTIVYNTAIDGGGIYHSGSSSDITNSIVYSNGASNIVGSPKVNYSCIEGGWPTGTGNIPQDPPQPPSLNPSYPSSSPYHLNDGSPCIDTGINKGHNADWGPDDLDIDGYLRIHPEDGKVDMGISEHNSEPPTPSDTEPPEASGPNPPDGSYTANSTPEISVNLTNGQSGVNPDSIVLTVAGVDYTTSTDPPLVWNDPVVSYTPEVGLDDGEVEVAVYAEDNAGNPMTTEEWSFFVDTEGPTVSITSPFYGASTADRTPLIKVKLEDDLSGVDPDSIDLWVAGANVTPDITWNAPYVSYTPTADLPTGLVDVTVDAKDNVGNAMAQHSWSFTITIEYTLTTDNVGNGSIIANPSPGPYLKDTSVKLTAEPDPHWSFTGWSDDLTGTEKSKLIKMDSDKTVTANFIQVEYTMTTSTAPSGSGSVTANWTGPYHYGDVVELTAVPNAGYVFDHWSGALSGSDNSTSLTIDGDMNVTAHFTQLQYTITTSVNPSGAGSVAAIPAGTYHYGDVVELTATPSAGYAFDHWSGDLTGSANPDYLTIDGDKEVTAHFVLAEYTLTTSVDPAGGGSVTANSTGPYHYGDVVELTAVPNAGYVFDHWSGNLTGSANPASLTIDGDETVTAHFTQSEYTMTTSADPAGGGSVTANSTGPYHQGDVVELTAVPNAGYVFDHWSGNLTGSANPAPLTVDGDETVTAHFTEKLPPESAYDIKSATIDKLEGAKGDNKLINRRIDRIIGFINASLNDKYWEDNISRLDARRGSAVFSRELAAAVILEAQIRISGKQIRALERIIAWKEKKGRPTDKEEAKLAAIQNAIPVFQEVLEDLAQADKVLAEVAIGDAKDTPVQNPRFQGMYDRFIARAEKEMDRAVQLLNDGRPSKAIMYFKKAWQYAQTAMRFASRG